MSSKREDDFHAMSCVAGFILLAVLLCVQIVLLGYALYLKLHG